MADFPATRLSIIERIREGDEDARRDALGVFIEAYRPALIDFLVKAKRVEPADADDLVNDFILNKIMNSKVLDLANGRDRFRGALRTCIQRYLIDSIRSKSRQPVASVTASEELAATDTESTVDIDPIDRIWATAIFTSTLAQMKQECVHWDIFLDRVLTQPPIGYEEIMERYDYKNPRHASNALMTAKRTFNRILSACIEAQTSISPKSVCIDISDETHLLQIFLTDPIMVANAVESIKDRPAPSHSLTNLDTIGGAIVFYDPSADALWSKQETLSLFEHLLNQTLGEIGALNVVNSNLTLKEALDTTSKKLQRADLISLKDHFNHRGKTGNSDLPRRIDVAMTFAWICRFALGYGSVHDITSTDLQTLTERLQQMMGKPWLPSEIENLYRFFVRQFQNN